MKCTICGQPTLPGANLCRACRAAIKRARDQTVSEFMPLAAVIGSSGAGTEAHVRGDGHVRRRHAAPKSPPAATASRTAGTSSAHAHAANPVRERRRALVLLAVILAAFIVGVAGVQWLNRSGGPAASPPPPASTFTPIEPARDAAAAVPVVPQSPTDAPATIAPAKVPPVATRKDARSAMPAPAASAPVVVPVPEPAPTPVQEVPEPPRPAPTPDRWQALSATLARCAREDLLVGVVCEQRARLAACDGYWGEVPQCPRGIVNDHGQ